MAAVTPQSLKSNVVAVPPVAWTADLTLNRAENVKLVRHIEQGGVSHLLYGGNANLYHFSLGQLRSLLEMLNETVAAETRIIPSVGADFGKMMDQAEVLKAAGSSTAMLLPMSFPSQPSGVASAVRKFADKAGFPVILYVKREGYIATQDIRALVEDGAVMFVKYAIERDQPEHDPVLSELIDAIGTDRIGSGMGETPLHAHFPKFNVATYTSGGVCIAPRAASALHHAFKQGDSARVDSLIAPFLAFETVRARYNGISVLHDAVSIANVAQMGPILPMMANVADNHRPAVEEVAQALVALEARVQAA